MAAIYKPQFTRKKIYKIKIIMYTKMEVASRLHLNAKMPTTVIAETNFHSQRESNL